MVALGILSCAPNDSRSAGIWRVSSGAYCSGVGVMKIELLLADLNGLLGWRPALAVISPHRRCYLRVDSYRPDNYVVDTALLESNFPPSSPRAWG